MKMARADVHVVHVFCKKVVLDCPKKSVFGFLKPKIVDESYIFKIPIFTHRQSSILLNLYRCLLVLLVTCVLECKACEAPVCLTL